MLVIYDTHYPTRFWTNFESWLSIQGMASTGLVPADKPSADEGGRVTVKCSGAAKIMKADDNIFKLYRGKSCKEVRDILEGDDILVTNGKVTPHIPRPPLSQRH